MSGTISSVNARSLAQEIAAQYFASYDPYERHRVNVEHCLRGPVTAVTINLLTNANGEVEALKASEQIAPPDSAVINHTEEKKKED